MTPPNKETMMSERYALCEEVGISTHGFYDQETGNVLRNDDACARLNTLTSERDAALARVAELEEALSALLAAVPNDIDAVVNVAVTDAHSALAAKEPTHAE